MILRLGVEVGGEAVEVEVFERFVRRTNGIRGMRCSNHDSVEKISQAIYPQKTSSAGAYDDPTVEKRIYLLLPFVCLENVTAQFAFPQISVVLEVRSDRLVFLFNRFVVIILCWLRIWWLCRRLLSTLVLLTARRIAPRPPLT